MITVLTGDNDFLLKKSLGQLIDDYQKSHSELNIERIDAEESQHEQIFDALTNISMFDSNKLVVVRNFVADKKLVEDIEDILAKIPETTEVILVAPKIDKRGKSYKLLKEVTDFKEFGQSSAPNLPTWLVEEAASNGAELNRSDANYLVERVGEDQLSLSNELQKLIAYDKKITRQNIDLLCEPKPQSTVFQLLDAAFAGDAKRALSLYEDQRQQRVEPMAILGMIAWQLHILAVVKTAKDKTAGEIAKEAKLSPFVVNKSIGLTRRLQLSRLKLLVKDILKLDIRLKSESIDADEALKNYIVELAT